MKNTLLNPPSFFLFFALLIETVISKPELILNKFFSIKTKHNYFIFNVDNFLYNEDIYLTIKSKGKCENFIEYQFYDDIEDISIPNVDFKFRTESYLKEKKNYINDEDGVSLYYAITKRKDILFKKKGNLLYFEFNCGSEVEIINTKERHEQPGLVILYYASLSLLIIIFLIIIKGVICSFIEIKKNSYYIKKNWKKTQSDMRYPKEKIVYVVQDQTINVNENARNNINNNINNINNKDNYQGNDSLDYPDLSQNNSPEVSQSTKILYSTNSNFFTP